MPENQITTDFINLTSSSFVTISHINYWDQVNSWKNLWKFWNDPLCRKNSDPFLLLNVAAYWQSSNTETYAKKLFKILENNIDSEGNGIDLRIYVRYCSLQEFTILIWLISDGWKTKLTRITQQFRIRDLWNGNPEP